MLNVKKHTILLVLSLVCSAGFAQTARIPELESDTTYMACLEEDVRLQGLIDSLSDEAAATRELFRDHPEQREQHSRRILSIEEELFRLRSEKGKLIDRINAIEQEWVLRSMSDAGTEEGSSPGEELRGRYAEAPRHRMLVRNACFGGELPHADYLRLLEAQRRECRAAEHIDRFAENYARLLDLQSSYLAETAQDAADSLFDCIGELEAENSRLDDSLAAAWSYVFDNKSYAYSYLLDRFGCEEVLERETGYLADAVRESDAVRGRYASDAVAAYFLQKRALVGCELAVAAELELSEAQDSLKEEAAYLRAAEYRLPRVEVERRYLLDYEPIDFTSPSKYSARNPVPACKVYEHGTIYRIRLGRYKVKQAVGIFRGVCPLAVLKEEDGRYGYYAGGFATKVEAQLARELLLKRGFRRPEIVRWTDGAMEEVGEEGDAGTFRVEIAGAAALSAEVRGVIREQAADKELARVGQTFVVGSFDERSTAERLARAVEAADPSLRAEVLEIAGE